MTAGIKLSFWYHMLGSKMGDLKVEGLGSAGSWSSLFLVSGAQGDVWHNAEVAIPGDVHQLRIIGVTGNGWASDMAVDDITVVPA